MMLFWKLRVLAWVVNIPKRPRRPRAQGTSQYVSQYVICTLNLSLTVIAYICGLWPAISRVTEARPKSDNRLGNINAFLEINDVFVCPNTHLQK